MKKLLLLVPLVAGASWGGASYYAGTQAQGAYDQLLAQLNEMKPFTLVNESYEGGFVESRAVTQVMDSAAPDANVLFRLQHDIDHSPVGVSDGNVRVGAASIRTTLIRDDSLSESVVEFMEGFTESEPFVVDTRVSFGGKTDNRLQVSSYRFQQDETNASFGGIDYSMSITGDAVLGSGTLGAVAFSSEGNELMLSQGVITTDLSRISQSLYSGTNGIDFDRLLISSEDNATLHVTLESIGIHSDTQVQDDQLSGKVLMTVANIDSMLPLNAVSVESTVSNLSIEGVQSYIDTFSQFSVAELMLSDDPDITKRMLEAYLPMIGPGTGMDFGVTFSNDGGDASLDYGISVIGQSAPAFPAAGLASIVTIRDLLNVLRLEAHFDADAGAIDQTPLAMFMMSPEAQQVIVADGISYKADLTLSELIVDINGNPLAIEMMLGDKLDTPLAELLSM